MSNVDTPPDPWFSNIIFNPDYFVAPTGGSGGISQSYADSHYLQSGANVNAISTANSTIFNNKVNIYGNVGIGMSGNPKGLLDVRGRTFISILEASVVPYTNGNQLMVCGAGNANFEIPMQLTINDTNAINMALYIGTNYNGAIADSYSSIQSAYFGTASKSLALNAGGGNIGIGTTNPRQLVDVKAAVNTDATFTIRAGNESQKTILYLGTPLNGSLNPLKVALIAEGLSSYSRAKLHFCLDNTYDNLYPGNNASISNARMTINPNGNVGIGTTNPQAPLHLHNASNNQYVRIQITDNNTGTGAADGVSIEKSDLHDLFLKVHENARMIFFTNNLTRATITADGNFLIEQKLVIGNNNNYPDLQIGNINGNNVAVATGAGSFSTSTSAGDMVIRSLNKLLLLSGGGVAPFCINTNNFIQLGKGLTVIPTFPVTVNTNESANQAMASPYSAAIYSGFNTNYASTNPPIGFGVLCTAAYSTACYFYSDRRIKKDFEPINNSLEILEKINLTTYKYIDYVVKGNMTNYGIIAQEVEEVIPEIINTHKDFIPNIYKNANSYDGLNTIYIDTTDITIGDKIKIYNDTNQEYLIDVVDIDVDANYIVIENPIENYKQDTLLFFYGKEIPDFKNVNYDALFVINMRATQELYKRLKAIETWAISMGMGAP